jgi:hypothetical protein
LIGLQRKRCRREDIGAVWDYDTAIEMWRLEEKVAL